MSTPASASPAPSASVRAGWTWPVQPQHRVVHGFDPPAQRWLAGHRGVDLAASPGTQVLAAGAGRVTFAGLLAGRGVVVVSHGRLRTTYEPLVPSVGVGQQVAAGQVLGTLTLNSGHCLPEGCLHWGLRQGDVYLDPLTLLRPLPPRLLPLGRTTLSAGPLDSAFPSGHPSSGGPVDEPISRETTGPAPAAQLTPSARAGRSASAPLGLAAGTTAVAVGLALTARSTRRLGSARG